MALSYSFAADVLTAVAPVAINTEFTVTHNLERVPLEGFIVLRGASGNIYRSGTAWTTTTVYLKCDVASVSFTILLF